MDREEWGLWKQSPATQAVFRELKKVREEGIKELASGVYANDVGRMNLVVGKINALTSIISGDILEEIENVRGLENTGTSSGGN